MFLPHSSWGGLYTFCTNVIFEIFLNLSSVLVSLFPGFYVFFLALVTDDLHFDIVSGTIYFFLYNFFLPNAYFI